MENSIWVNNRNNNSRDASSTVKPQILSLSVVETSSGSDSAPRRLQCEAEGHPPPNITWLSASGSLLGVQTLEGDPYRLVSSVPYLQDDVLTCRVQSRLGAAERRYPSHNTLIITSLSVCGIVVLLLLLSTGFFFYRRNRGEDSYNSRRDDVFL